MNGWFPSPGDYSPRRLFSLDLLRGLDMFYLVCVSVVLRRVFPALGADPAWGRFFCSHPWGGFTLYDLIMPLFIFMSGAAVPFALGSRLDNGRPTPAFHRHVWTRVAMLWILGMLAQGNLHQLSLHSISPYNNTLQTIAVGYVVTAYVLLIPSWAVRIAIPVVLAAAYGLIVHFGGDYTKLGNATYPFEMKILNAILPADNTNTANITKYGYTWFLPSLMFPVMALAGAFSTEILRAKSGDWTKALSLAAFGLGSLALGWTLEFSGVECVKQIFTVSFTFQAIGWCVLALMVLYVVTDIWKCRRGTGVLLLFGQFALTAYMCGDVFYEACKAFAARTLGGLAHFFPAPWQPVVDAVLFACVIVGVLVVRRRIVRERR